MRIGCGIAGVVIAIAACGSSAAAPTTTKTDAARPGPAHCGPAGARTLAVNSRARVYVTGGEVYGCVSGGRAYLLGHSGFTRPGQDRVGRLALGGVYAGYAAGRMGVDTLASQVIVRRLDSGRTMHAVSATTQPVGPEFFQMVAAIVIKPDGAVAWIADGGSIVRYTHHVELVRIDRRGEARLDSGPGIYPPSLRLSGSRLTWRNHASVRSATLL